MKYKKITAIVLAVIFIGNLKSSGQTLVNNFLKEIRGTMHPYVSWYTGTRLDSVHELDGGILKNKTSEWSCTVNETPDTEKDAIDVTILFKLEKGNVSSAAVSVAFDFSNWSTENYILVPAMIYGGNRFRILPIKYPPYIHDAADRPLDMPITTTDILHLNKDGSHAKIEMIQEIWLRPCLVFLSLKIKRA